MGKQGTILVGTIGETWSRTGLRQGMHSDCIVKALLADPWHPGVVYAGTDMGLYRSADGGGTWRLLDTPMTGAIVWSMASRRPMCDVRGHRDSQQAGHLSLH